MQVARLAIWMCMSASICAGGARAPAPEHIVAIVLRCEAPPSKLTEQALRAELVRLLGPAGIRAVVVRDQALLDLGAVDTVVWVGCKGCMEVPAGKGAALPRGALGWVKYVDGVFQPFITVDCSLVASHVREVLMPPQHLSAKPLMGRALARVLVHELMHYLTRSREHLGSRLFREQLEPQALLEPGVVLEAVDLEALGRAVGPPPRQSPLGAERPISY